MKIYLYTHVNTCVLYNSHNIKKLVQYNRLELVLICN